MAGGTTRTPGARRLIDLRLTVFGTWLAVGFAMVIVGALMTGPSGSARPAPPGLTEANRVVPWVFFVVALVWLLSWFPVFSIRVRIRTLWWCRIVIWVTAGAWLAWSVARR